MKKEAKTNGRWTKDEHLKFLEGRLLDKVRTSHLRQKLEEDLAVCLNTNRVANQVSCSKVFPKAPREWKAIK